MSGNKQGNYATCKREGANESEKGITNYFKTTTATTTKTERIAI